MQTIFFLCIYLLFLPFTHSVHIFHTQDHQCQYAFIAASSGPMTAESLRPMEAQMVADELRTFQGVICRLQKKVMDLEVKVHRHDEQIRAKDDIIAQQRQMISYQYNTVQECQSHPQLEVHIVH